MNPTQEPPQWEDLVIREPEAKPAPAPVRVPAPAAAPALPPFAVKPAASRSAHQVQAAYLAHELRAPVTSIRLGLEILSEQVDGRLESDERQMLQLAIKNTHRLEGLVNDIMDYSKIAAGKMAIAKDACDARALVDEAVDALKAAATSKGVKIVKDYGPLLPRVSAENRRVVQVLINLLSNAIKFTPARGCVTVAVSEGRHAHEGTLMFKVKDTGAGIAADQLEKIFGMFEQAGAANVRKAEGTGLGLTLARAMVELHGGRIWAESWKGCGATFCFTIPIASVDQSRPVEVYAEPLQVHGLVAEFARRFNAFLAMVV
ncbi:MAG TPA: HAMP domain-containing sensor histidine kinase [Elusimicrobiota bacterium]|jgi:signal transduction histidine kinase|nr:HAMP domain-containing sensor histidine kinase [Elusimicrobiota bacterium]